MSSSYPGGKGLAFRQIINQMPPHGLYIEAFLGSGAVLRNKRPAAGNIGIEIDAAVIAEYRSEFDAIPNLQVIHGDALEILSGTYLPGDTLVYCDPPYLLETRSQQRGIYQYEFMTEDEHAGLLGMLKRLPCMVAISGYWSELYGQALRKWRCCSYNTITRGGGQVEEFLWMNYPEPMALHDYGWLGEDYRERERIKRKQKRWRERLRKMDRLERLAMMSVLGDILPTDAAVGSGQPTPEMAMLANNVLFGDARRRRTPEMAMLDRKAE